MRNRFMDAAANTSATSIQALSRDVSALLGAADTPLLQYVRSTVAAVQATPHAPDSPRAPPAPFQGAVPPGVSPHWRDNLCALVLCLLNPAVGFSCPLPPPAALYANGEVHDTLSREFRIFLRRRTVSTPSLRTSVGSLSVALPPLPFRATDSHERVREHHAAALTVQETLRSLRGAGARSPNQHGTGLDTMHLLQAARRAYWHLAQFLTTQGDDASAAANDWVPTVTHTLMLALAEHTTA
jgi:hypothetical protein